VKTVVTSYDYRLVRAMLKDNQPTTVLRVARWVEENINVAIIAKQAVYFACAALRGEYRDVGGWASSCSASRRKQPSSSPLPRLVQHR
jgi:hypothetical protein